MEGVAQMFAVPERFDQIVRQILGVARHKADPLDPFHFVHHAQQLCEIHLLSFRFLQVTVAALSVLHLAVGVYVLAQQRDLLAAACRQLLHLRQDVLRTAAPLPAPRIGHDAVSAEVVAAVHDVHEGFKRVFPRCRQPFRDCPSVFPDLHDLLVRLPHAVQQFREIRDVVGAEHQIYPGVFLLQRVDHVLLLHHAAADAYGLGGVILLGMLQLPQHAEELLIRVLPHAAGVQDDDVCLLLLFRFYKSIRLQHARQGLRVALVHLAAEGDDMIRLCHL